MASLSLASLFIPWISVDTAVHTIGTQFVCFVGFLYFLKVTLRFYHCALERMSVRVFDDERGVDKLIAD